MRVLVIAGGVSHERDVSLSSAARVVDALKSADAEARTVEPGEQLLRYLEPAAAENQAADSWQPDVVWPLAHGAIGEDGGLQDLLSGSGIPFVGSSSEGARLAWDKSVAKALVARHGLLTPDSAVLSRELIKQIGSDGAIKQVLTRLGDRVVVKPVAGGSAQGLTVLPAVSELGEALAHGFSYSDRVLVERHVDGTELAISILDLGFGARALPPVEISTASRQFGFLERYVPGESQFYVPARLSLAAIGRAQDAALRAHSALRLSQISRIDLIVDSEGTPWFLEANVVPGMTETSLLPQAVIADGERLSETYLEICRSAIRHS